MGARGYAAASFEPNGTEKSRVISMPSQVISFRHFPSLGPEVLAFSQLFSTCVEYFFPSDCNNGVKVEKRS